MAVDIRVHITAKALIESLASDGVLIRKLMVAPQNRFIRVGVGTDEEHQHLESVFKKHVKAG